MLLIPFGKILWLPWSKLFEKKKVTIKVTLSGPSGSWVIDPNNISHLLSNNARTTKPTEISMIFLSLPDNLLQNNRIFSKYWWFWDSWIVVWAALYSFCLSLRKNEPSFLVHMSHSKNMLWNGLRNFTRYSQYLVCFVHKSC